MPDLLSGLAFYVVFLLSTVLHEGAHAWAALRGGDPTAYHGGQVTLNPIPHMRREPFGMVVLPLISVIMMGWPFGFASAPYNPQWALRHPKRAAWMALAGPAANLVLVLLAALLIRVGMLAGVFHAPESVRFAHVVGTDGAGLSGVAFFLSTMFSLNLVLFALNILPLPPLDGSAAMPLLLSDQTANRYQLFLWTNPALSWVGIILAWNLFGRIFMPVFLAAVNLLYPGAHYG